MESNKLSTNLLSLLIGWGPEPSEELKKVIEKSGEFNLSIETQVSDMSRIVKVHFMESAEDLSEEIIISRITVVKRLYYRFLDHLISKELNGRTTFDCKALLKEQMVHKVLFACSVELVNFAHNSSLTFPWVLGTLHITAYNFYKIIELVIRADECLSRELIKHLNSIEVLILERLAWDSESSLWKYIYYSDMSVPTCDDVLREHILLDPGSSASTTNIFAVSPFKKNYLLQSPRTPLKDGFQSPFFIRDRNLLALAGSVKRNLCDSLGDSSSSSTSVSTLNCKNELINKESVLSKNELINKESVLSKNESMKTKDKPMKSRSLSLFFRKFYLLSSNRLRSLCDDLSLDDITIRQKIWTFYQTVISSNIALLVDRHLDQLLMCSVYIVCKFHGIDEGFAKIIRSYDRLPYSSRSVYENVVLGPLENIADMCQKGVKKCLQEKDHIVKFYNSLFLKVGEDIVKKLGVSGPGRIALSPLLVNLVANQESPRRKVSDGHSLFVRSMRAGSSPLILSPKTKNFCFTESPIKPLQPLSDETICNVAQKKRGLTFESDERGFRDTKQMKDLLNQRCCWAPIKKPKME